MSHWCTSPTVGSEVSHPSPPYGEPRWYGMRPFVTVSTTLGRTFSYSMRAGRSATSVAVFQYRIQLWNARTYRPTATPAGNPHYSRTTAQQRGGAEVVRHCTLPPGEHFPQTRRVRGTLHRRTGSPATPGSRVLHLRSATIYRGGQLEHTITDIVEHIRLVDPAAPDTHHVLVPVTEEGEPVTIALRGDSGKEVVCGNPVRAFGIGEME